MADEQPNTPSAEAQSTDAAPPGPSSDSSGEQPSQSPGWWQKLFSRRGQEADSQDADSGTEDATSSKLALTQEELDRRVQAETDRREAKRAQEAKARQRRELRDSDPWAYAEAERKEEEVATGEVAMTNWFARVGTEHDRVAIDPLVEVLPKAERDRILGMQGAGTGLQGRKLVVTEGLKALEKHWKAEGAKDAENRLRRNPAFRKQLLAEARGQAVEPDLLPAVGGASEADKTVSALLRTHYGLR